ncbi:MAG: ornithine monooxygenase [Paucimonas sp.]|nr:ornithine monooxygenase [Paucimonas sp.]
MMLDLLGIGFGPANLALAVMLEEAGFAGSRLFLEARPRSRWQQDMLLPGADIQNHPLRDLVTPRNPRSRYSFINYLHEQGKLFEHLNLGLEFPLRKEYADYVDWVSSFFQDQVMHDTSVTDIRLLPGRQGYEVESASGQVWTCRSLVVAPGRTPFIPALFLPQLGETVFHSGTYLGAMQRLQAGRRLQRVMVVGGSQSAIEILLHLHRSHLTLAVLNVMRGWGYRLKDTSQFSEEVYFPQFVDFYYGCSPGARAELNRHLHYTNYSAADHDTIRQLYVQMYEDRLDGAERIQLVPRKEPVALCRQDGAWTVSLRDRLSGETSVTAPVDAIILATGYRNAGTGENAERHPPILSSLMPHLQVDKEGVLLINRDYSLSGRDAAASLPPIYLNGLCESSHGYGDAGSFSLLALRSRDIYHSLAARLESAEPGAGAGGQLMEA